MKYIWTNNKRWIEMGGPWFGSWNYKLAPSCMGIGGLILLAAFFMGAVLICKTDPITFLIKLWQIKTIEVALVRVIILLPISSILGSIIAYLNTRWFREKDIIIVYDNAVYVHDFKRGGILLKKGDVETLAIISDIFLIFYLKKMRRGIKYLCILIEEPMPEKILKKILKILKPEKFLKLEAGKRGLAYHIEVIIHLLAEKNPKIVKEFVERDYTEHWDAMRKAKFGFYGPCLGYLLDTLIALGMKKEALAIALAPALFSPEEYVSAMEKGIDWILNSKWRFFLLRTAGKTPDDLEFMIIFGPSLFAFGVFAVGGIFKLIPIPEPLIAMLLIYGFFSMSMGVYYGLSLPYYNSVVYFHAGRRSLFFFFLRALVDVLAMLFLYFLVWDLIHVIFFIIILVSCVFYSCVISGLYVFLNARRIAEGIVREFYRINPNYERIVEGLLESSMSTMPS